MPPPQSVKQQQRPHKFQGQSFGEGQGFKEGHPWRLGFECGCRAVSLLGVIVGQSVRLFKLRNKEFLYKETGHDTLKDCHYLTCPTMTLGKVSLFKIQHTITFLKGSLFKNAIASPCKAPMIYKRQCLLIFVTNNDIFYKRQEIECH